MEAWVQIKPIVQVLIVAVMSIVGGISVAAQPADVPIQKQGRHESDQEDAIAGAAKELFEADKAVKLAIVKDQLRRTTCDLSLPKVSNTKLSPREICDVARRSHYRVGWSFVCDKCSDWHINLAGGYAITTDGALATCYHVVQPEREIKDGCLVAVDEAGKVFAVTEVLAANRYSDCCIIRIAGEGLKPLPLNTNIYPGDMAYCYSDPLDHRGYFSSGIVNRFYQFPGRRPFNAPDSAAYAPTRLNVGTDWAPGSSGSAVLDEFGNAVGHVSTIGVLGEEERPIDEKRRMLPTMMVFHEAVAPRDVLRLVSTQKK